MDGETMTETAPECYATDDAFLTTMAWCWDQRCNDTTLSRLEQYWHTNAIGGAPLSEQPSPKWTYQETLQQIDESPTVEMVGSQPLSTTSLVLFKDWDLQYRTLGTFEHMEGNHSKYA